MALTKVNTGGLALDAVDNTILKLDDDYDLTGTVTGAGVPTGVIAMWHGAAGAIPSGWVICDGNNSTPNLTDKFIKSTGTAGGTGGSATTGAHTLTTSQMPSHTHSETGHASRAAGSNDRAGGGYSGYYTNSFSSDATGGGGSHTHPQSEPVFFALIFIMKT
jgi:hypothetical protein